MPYNNSKSKSGFSLIEILIVIGILGMLLSMSFYFFPAFGKRDALEKDVAGLVAMMREARSSSVLSKNASAFGVHLQENKAVLFEGDSYVSGGPNEEVMQFSKKVYLSSYSLNMGGSDIVFDRLTGNTSNYGTVTLSLKDNSTSTTITILETGVVK